MLCQTRTARAPHAPKGTTDVTDSNIPLALQPDSFSLPVVARLAQLPNRVVLRWPVTVHSLPGQALLLLRNGIAIVCDDQTYLTTELDAFSRVTFADDIHASIRLSLKKVDVEFASAAQAQHFGTAVTDRAAIDPAAGRRTAVPRRQSEAPEFGKLAMPGPPSAGQPSGYGPPPSWQDYSPQAPGPMSGPPASLGDRFLARLIDAGVILALLIVPALLSSALKSSASFLSIMLSLVSVVILFGYEFVLIAKYGQTIGKRVMKVRVVTSDGGQIPRWARAAGRTFVPSLIGMATFGTGGLLFNLSPLFDDSPWKRGWYDKLAGTVVIVGQSPTWFADSGHGGRVSRLPTRI